VRDRAVVDDGHVPPELRRERRDGDRVRPAPADDEPHGRRHHLERDVHAAVLAREAAPARRERVAGVRRRVGERAAVPPVAGHVGVGAREEQRVRAHGRRAGCRAPCRAVDAHDGGEHARGVGAERACEQRRHRRPARRRERLEEHLDQPVAAEAEPPDRVVVGARVVRDDVGAPVGVHAARVLGEVGLEAAAAHQPHGRPVDAHEHARADAAVARADDADHGGEHHALAGGRGAGERVDHRAVRRHRPARLTPTTGRAGRAGASARACPWPRRSR
jgi:hypothetical protein